MGVLANTQSGLQLGVRKITVLAEIAGNDRHMACNWESRLASGLFLFRLHHGRQAAL